MFEKIRKWAQKTELSRSEKITLTLALIAQTCDDTQYLEHEKWIEYINSDKYIYTESISETRLKNSFI